MSNRRGYATLMMTMTLVAMCGVLGLVTDVGWAYYKRQGAQAAAEAAAIAATVYASANGMTCGQSGVTCSSTATSCASVTGTSSSSAACQYASANGFTDGSNNQSVSITSGTGAPPGTSGVSVDYWVQVAVSQNLNQLFSAVLGNSSTMKSGAVVVGSASASTAPGTVIVLGASGTTTTTDGTVTFGSGDNVWVCSTSSDAVDMNHNNPWGHDSFTVNNGKCLRVAGGCRKNGATVSPSPVTGVSCPADPYRKMSPPSDTTSCTFWNSGAVSYSRGNYTLNPGTYCGDLDISGSASITFNPGTYLFHGDLNIGTSGTVSGSGVTLYMKSGTCSMTSGNITLSPPTSGTYKGVTYYQDRSNTNQCTLTAGSNQCISGAVYAPAATVQHCGGSSAAAPNQTIVCNKIAYTGGTNVNTPATSIYTPTVGLVQ